MTNKEIAIQLLIKTRTEDEKIRKILKEMSRTIFEADDQVSELVNYEDLYRILSTLLEAANNIYFS